MKVLFDTNVILDALQARQPFVHEASRLMGMAEKQEIHGYLCATTITTLSYLVTRSHDKNHALQSIRKLLSIYEIASVNRAVLTAATQTAFADFEDAVLHESAQLVGIDAIVTRNTTDFKTATIAIYLPHELLAVLQQSSTESEYTALAHR